MGKRSRPAAPVKPKRADTVSIAFIHPGQVSAYFTTSLLGTMLYDQNGPRRIVGLTNEWSSANVSAPRNYLTGKFVDDSSADWLLWIDSDMAWDHDALDLLLEVADPVTAPIVGGLCFGASHDRLFPTIYQMTQTEDGRPTTCRVTDYPDNGIVQCAATGAAFLLIHRSVLTAIRDWNFNEAFPWFQETELAGQPAGEDLTFCLRAGICGFPVHVHTGVKIGHHKSHLLTHELFQSQLREAEPVDNPVSAGR
jgi:GT2 family glycosyltransferase